MVYGGGDDMADNIQILLSTIDAAQQLGMKSQTLRKWRHNGRGPRYVRLGNRRTGRAMYRPSDLDAWLAANTYSSTSAESAVEAVEG